MRAVWVVANRFAFHTHHMSGTTTVNTFVTRASALVRKAVASGFPHAGASVLSAAGKKRHVKRFGPTPLLVLPFLVVLVPEAVDSTRTIDVTVLRYAFSLSASRCGSVSGSDSTLSRSTARTDFR